MQPTADVFGRWWKVWTFAIWALTGIAIVGVIVGASRDRGFWFTEVWSVQAAAVSVGLVTWAIDLLLRWDVGDLQNLVETNPARVRRLGLKGLVIGTDGRASTSKVQVVLWTYSVLFVLVFLLFYGNTWVNSSKSDASRAPGEANDLFDTVISSQLQPQYFVLLGFPLVAALAAKALTSAKVADGDLVKSDSDKAGFGQGLREIVANDKGQTDLLDFQYFLFNLVTLAYFFISFFTSFKNGVPEPELEGLPSLPETLLALSGASAATYAFKKALESHPGPVISAVSPNVIPVGWERPIVITGTGLSGFNSESSEGTAHSILLDSVPLEASQWTATSVTARIRPGQGAAGIRPNATVDLIVYDDNGLTSAAFKVNTTE
ncbi:IPT/TIG domain-containing protein [Streptomyces sp. QTS52]